MQGLNKWSLVGSKGESNNDQAKLRIPNSAGTSYTVVTQGESPQKRQGKCLGELEYKNGRDVKLFKNNTNFDSGNIHLLIKYRELNAVV